MYELNKTLYALRYPNGKVLTNLGTIEDPKTTTQAYAFALPLVQSLKQDNPRGTIIEVREMLEVVPDMSRFHTKPGQIIASYGKTQIGKGYFLNQCIANANTNLLVTAQFEQDLGRLAKDIAKYNVANGTKISPVSIKEKPAIIRQLLAQGGCVLVGLSGMYSWNRMLEILGAVQVGPAQWNTSNLAKKLAATLSLLDDEGDRFDPSLLDKLVKGDASLKMLLKFVSGVRKITATYGALILSEGLTGTNEVVADYSPTTDIYIGLPDLSLVPIPMRPGKFDDEDLLRQFVSASNKKERSWQLVNAAMERDGHKWIVTTVLDLHRRGKIKLPKDFAIATQNKKAVTRYNINEDVVATYTSFVVDGEGNDTRSTYADQQAFYDALQEEGVSHSLLTGGVLLGRGGRFKTNDNKLGITDLLYPHLSSTHLELATQAIGRITGRAPFGSTPGTVWTSQRLMDEGIEFAYVDGPVLAESVNLGIPMEQIPVASYAMHLVASRKRKNSRSQMPKATDTDYTTLF